MNPNQKICSRCGNLVSRKNMSRHLKTCGSDKITTEPQRPCPSCGTSITLSHMSRHVRRCCPGALRRKHVDPPPSISKVARLDQQPDSTTHSDPRPSTSHLHSDPQPSTSPTLQLEEEETAFQGRLKTYLIRNYPGMKDPANFLQSSRALLQEKISEHVAQKNVKTNLVLLANFKKPVGNQEEIKEMNFKTKNYPVLFTTDIEDYLDRAQRKLLKELDEFYTKGSGWTLNQIISLELRVNRYVPLRGSSYIELPQKISARRAVLNILNSDQKCFLWSVLAALHPVYYTNHPYRIGHYVPYEHDLDDSLQGIDFPVSLDHVKLFEKRSGISINVYAYDEKLVIYPLIVTREEKQRHVDLLYIRNETTSHYCLINDLCRLVRSQISKHKGKIWLCKRCLLHFTREDILNKHKEDCKEHEAVKIVIPQEGDSIKFKNYNRGMRVPYAIYADFECILTPIQTCQPPKFNADGLISYNHPYQKHEAISFSTYTVFSEGHNAAPFNYFGSDAAQVFVTTLFNQSRRIAHLYSRDAAVPMHLTQEDLVAVNTATQCHICGNTFDDASDRVRDHDHLTGRFRGMAHNSCNLNFKKPGFIPVFIHNLSGYDTHLFIKMFGLNNETIDVIPNTEERYISYSVHVDGGVTLRFLDSYKFMASSLDKLVNNLAPDQFHHTSKFYTGEKLQLLTKKGVYPYDYMDSIDKFNDTSLPEKHHFYNRLNRTEIKDEDYVHAMNVWNKFNIQNMREYTILYNQTDVLLLADVMESFRDVCQKTYQLDPAWYYTSPGLAWDAMLKTTSTELQLLSDYDMVLMIGKGIRGGVSQCSNRHFKANNPYMPEYDPSKPTSYLTYLDANNLYGWAMSQQMPYGDFKWVDPNSVDVTRVPDDHHTGYILEVDLDYPKHLHDQHSDLPLAPEKRTPPGHKDTKLLGTLFDKRGYVLHYKNLKQYLSLGMRLNKVHRVLSFSQSAWLKSYIDLNTTMRTKAANEFEKDFFKLMNNSVFGKTMENIRNRVGIRLATKEQQVDKWIAQPNFQSRTIFTEHLAAVHMAKTKLVFNKPIYVGMSILDISKTLMYDFHYNVVKRKYGDKAKVQYTDTDSLLYAILTSDIYSDMKTMLDKLDTSEYPEPNRYGLPRVNKKVIGKFKDELSGRIMYEHVGLRSKMYAHRAENDGKGGTNKKAKGVKKAVLKEEITFQDYLRCLQTKKLKYTTMNFIRSDHHNVFTKEIHKIALSANDDKRCVLTDGITTLPWGHYSIVQSESEPNHDLVELAALLEEDDQPSSAGPPPSPQPSTSAGPPPSPQPSTSAAYYRLLEERGIREDQSPPPSANLWRPW